jgi:hypothetical protein
MYQVGFLSAVLPFLFNHNTIGLKQGFVCMVKFRALTGFPVHQSSDNFVCLPVVPFLLLYFNP